MCFSIPNNNEQLWCSIFIIYSHKKNDKNNRFNYSTSSYLNSLYILERKVIGLINKQIQLILEHTKQQEMQT